MFGSNVVRSSHNPTWQGTELDLELCCNGDKRRALKVVVYDHQKTGKHKEMGEFETTMERFLQAQDDGIPFTLLRKDAACGQVIVVEAKMLSTLDDRINQRQAVEDDDDVDGQDLNRNVQREPVHPSPVGPDTIQNNRPAFIDYLRGGCEMSLAVAIDFTGSNGTFVLLFGRLTGQHLSLCCGSVANVCCCLLVLTLNTCTVFRCLSWFHLYVFVLLLLFLLRSKAIHINQEHYTTSTQQIRGCGTITKRHYSPSERSLPNTIQTNNSLYGDSVPNTMVCCGISFGVVKKRTSTVLRAYWRLMRVFSIANLP